MARHAPLRFALERQRYYQLIFAYVRVLFFFVLVFFRLRGTGHALAMPVRLPLGVPAVPSGQDRVAATDVVVAEEETIVRMFGCTGWFSVFRFPESRIPTVRVYGVVFHVLGCPPAGR